MKDGMSEVATAPETIGGRHKVERPGRPPTNAEMQRCVRRELAFRARVFSRRVEAGNMSPEEADREQWLMAGVLEALKRMDGFCRMLETSDDADMAAKARRYFSALPNLDFPVDPAAQPELNIDDTRRPTGLHA